MRTLRRTLTMTAAATAMSALAAGPALAHGGSVSPPADQRPCRDLHLDERGAFPEELHPANGGLSTAGGQGAAAAWRHCPQ